MTVCADWVTDADLNLCGACAGLSFDATVQTRILTAASNMLYRLSGRQFPGECSETVRPCTRRIAEGLSADQFPAGIPGSGSRFGRTLSVCGCQRGRRCGCTTLDEITLGRPDLRSIIEVRIDGVEVPTSDYRIDDDRYLVDLTGDGWPCCQDLTADPATDDDTFEVTFTWGLDPPADGVHAAATLACEMLLACDPDTAGACRLPPRVTSLSRQGVDISMLDASDLIENGRTGIFEIDMFIWSTNPTGRQRPGRVWSPDIGRRVRRASNVAGS